MLVRAKIGFAGAFSMYKGQILECSDNAILQDLLKCGYVEEYVDKSIEKESVTTAESPKGGTKNESKRRNSK